MSFIPSMYKSVPQVKTGAGSVVISSVDPNYTRLSILGFTGIGGGTVSANIGMASLIDATHISLNAAGGNIKVLVEEFHAAFFRQPFQYGTVVIPSGSITATTAHGLTLGPNAFVLWVGNVSDRAADSGAGLALQETQVRGSLTLVGANIQADVNLVDYFPAAPGSVTFQYLLIDPR